MNPGSCSQISSSCNCPIVVRLKWKWLPRILSDEGERILKKERWRSKDVLKKDSSCVHKRN